MLIVNESLHDHLVDNIDLTQAHILVVAESTHDHFAERVAFPFILSIIKVSLIDCDPIKVIEVGPIKVTLNPVKTK